MYTRITQPHIHTYYPQLLVIIISLVISVHFIRTRLLYFLFLKPEGRYGPHGVWDHMGWVGHPAH